jgi:GTP-binding protein
VESNFVDYVKILCRSGKGGRGSMHLRHVKYNPLGGPDGGDGGRGGNIILRGNHNYWTLLHLRYERHIFAGHGGNGGKDKCHGTDGKDVYIDVPCGTVVYNAETGKYVCDITYDGQEVMLLKGGRGGLGNFQFRSATNQAPRYAQPGEPMQEMTIIMELKLLADVGLVGFPNAGKSTLVSALSNAKPKIANYPFTTMEPSLGIVGYREGKSFVMADIPGIIEGAAEGRGLGLRFLRHIERNSLLLFMVPGDTDNILREYNILLDELRKFNPELLSKQRVLAVTKCDLLDEELIAMLKEELEALQTQQTQQQTQQTLQTHPQPLPGGRGADSSADENTDSKSIYSPLSQGGAGGGSFLSSQGGAGGGSAVGGSASIPIVFISAVTGFGLDELKDVLWRELNSESNKLQTIQADDRLVHRDKDMTVFAQELIDEDAADDIEYVDDGEIEELEDFEYDDVQGDEA